MTQIVGMANSDICVRGYVHKLGDKTGTYTHATPMKGAPTAGHGPGVKASSSNSAHGSNKGNSMWKLRVRV